MLNRMIGHLENTHAPPDPARVNDAPRDFASVPCSKFLNSFSRKKAKSSQEAKRSPGLPDFSRVSPFFLICPSTTTGGDDALIGRERKSLAAFKAVFDPWHLPVRPRGISSESLSLLKAFSVLPLFFFFFFLFWPFFFRRSPSP